MPLTTSSLPFPAVVTTPDGTLHKMARLRVVGDAVQVFIYECGAVRLAGVFTPTDTTPPGRPERGVTPTWTFTTPEGAWYVAKGPGCGCGHPLKRANLDTVPA